MDAAMNETMEAALKIERAFRRDLAFSPGIEVIIPAAHWRAFCVELMKTEAARYIQMPPSLGESWGSGVLDLGGVTFRRKP